jgi:mRNA-degrading endonuclease RelE of RelBE toxin-antitoxin system
MVGRLRLLTVCETKEFARRAEKLWSEAERDEFVGYIAANPFVGDLIERTGGVRKVRWSRQGMGKRGGTRVIYYVLDENLPLYLLGVYAKSEADDISEVTRQFLRTVVAEVKGIRRRVR